MRKGLLGLLGSVAIIAGACGGAASPAPSEAPASQAPASQAPAASPTPEAFDPATIFATDYTPEAGTPGGTIVFGDWQEANEFNPYYYGNVTEANVVSAVYSGLLVQTHDFRLMPYDAVEAPTVQNGGVKVPGDGGDAMTVTWKLRDGLKWSDGQPLTCDDYKFAWEWVLDPDNTGLYGGTVGYEDITAVDCSGTEMVLHYKNIYEAYLFVPATPMPRHYFGTTPVADMVNHEGYRPEQMPDLPVSGAFKFESVTPTQELRLVRNDNYVSPGPNGHAAYLDNLIWKWYGDADAMIAGFRGGEIDFATDLQDSDIPKVADLGDQVSAVPALLYEFLRPNHGAAECSPNTAVADRGAGCPVSDPAIREAIKYAVNKAEINTRLLGGNTELANTSISPKAWYFAEEPSASQDLEKAKGILDAAGWVVGPDGVRQKAGLKAKIELCTTTRQVRQDTLALVAGWLHDIGIAAVVNPVGPPDIFASYNESTEETPCALSRHNFDLAEHAFLSSLDPNSSYTTYHSTQVEPVGGNSAQVNDPELDKALDTVKNSVDLSVIKDAMKTFQDIYVANTVEVPLYYRKNVELHAPVLGNFFANGTTQGPTWNSWDWYRKG